MVNVDLSYLYTEDDFPPLLFNRRDSASHKSDRYESEPIRIAANRKTVGVYRRWKCVRMAANKAPKRNKSLLMPKTSRKWRSTNGKQLRREIDRLEDEKSKLEMELTQLQLDTSNLQEMINSTFSAHFFSGCQLGKD